MPTPLDVFMDALQKRRKCEESFQSRNFTHTTERFSAPDVEMKCELTLPERPVRDHVSSLPAHTHTLEGFANTGAEMKCETKCEGSLTLPVPPVNPGEWITWTRADGQVMTGLVDAIGLDTAGTWIAFVLTGATWSLVNMKYATRTAVGGATHGGAVEGRRLRIE